MAQVTRVRLWGGTSLLVNAPLLAVIERLAAAAPTLPVKTPDGVLHIEKERIRSLTAEPGAS